jgi:hypothetical protein
LPANTLTASFGGTDKLNASSVFDDILFNVKVTFAEDVVIFVICAINNIDVDVIGAVYNVVFDVVKLAVTFLKRFRFAIG